MKFSHYKNSKVSMSNFEPVYKNLFRVLLTPPALIDGGLELEIENIKGITGLETDRHPTAEVQQSYQGATRSYLGALTDNSIDIAMTVQVNLDESNSMIGFQKLRDWASLGWNPRTGEMKLKKDYIGGPLQIFLHNKVFEVIREWTFPTVIVSGNLSAIELSYESGTDIFEVVWNFRADYWDDVTVK